MIYTVQLNSTPLGVGLDLYEKVVTTDVGFKHNCKTIELLYGWKFDSSSSMFITPGIRLCLLIIFILHGFLKFTNNKQTLGKLSYCDTIMLNNIPVHTVIPIEFFTICISVRLSERFKVTHHKINFVKNCPQWSLNSQPPDYHSGALTTELSRNLSFVSCTTSHVGLCLFRA